MDEETLIDYVEHSLPESRQAGFERHAAHCEQCRSAVLRMREFLGLWSQCMALLHADSAARACVAQVLDKKKGLIQEGQTRLDAWSQTLRQAVDRSRRHLLESLSAGSSEPSLIRVLLGCGWVEPVVLPIPTRGKTKRPATPKPRGRGLNVRSSWVGAKDVCVEVLGLPSRLSPPPMVLLVPLQPDVGTGENRWLAELKPNPKNPSIWQAQFSNVPPGRYAVAIEPLVIPDDDPESQGE
jgi:hypothetical protein